MNQNILITLLLLFVSAPSFATIEENPKSVCEDGLTDQASIDIFAPFPNPNTAREIELPDEEGKTAAFGMVGYLTDAVPYTVENVLHGYRHSIFPFIEENGKMHWFSFADRGVLDFADFKLSKSTKKFLKKSGYTVTMNENFKGVIEACGDASKAVTNVEKRADGNWIVPKTIAMYTKLHEMGYAHSVEVWLDGPNGRELVGGAYGVLVDGSFFGESLFTYKREASRLAFDKLQRFLSKKGLTWIDLQMVTSMTRDLGAKEISREEFIERLRKNQANPVHFPVEKLDLGGFSTDDQDL